MPEFIKINVDDFQGSKVPCSVVLSYMSPLGDIVSQVFNNVSPSCLRSIKTLLEYDKRKN